MNSKRISLAILALMLLAGTICLQKVMDQRRLRSFASGGSLLIFPKPSILRAASMGHSNLVADYYWLKTIQYLGACHHPENKTGQNFINTEILSPTWTRGSLRHTTIPRS